MSARMILNELYPHLIRFGRPHLVTQRLILKETLNAFAIITSGCRRDNYAAFMQVFETFPSI